MNLTEENGEKPNFGPNFGPYPNFYLYQILDIVASYHCIQFQEKLLFQTQENGKKSHFGPDLGLLGLNLGHQNCFVKLVVRHYFKLSSQAI